MIQIVCSCMMFCHHIATASFHLIETHDNLRVTSNYFNEKRFVSVRHSNRIDIDIRERVKEKSTYGLRVDVKYFGSEHHHGSLVDAKLGALFARRGDLEEDQTVGRLTLLHQLWRALTTRCGFTDFQLRTRHLRTRAVKKSSEK